MTATIRLGVVSGVIALGVLFSAAAPALADCSRGAPPSRIAAYRGHAFVATIAKISQLDDRLGHIAITFDVERTLVGPPSRQVTIRDNSGNCGMFFWQQLREGQRVVLTTDALAKWRDDTVGYAMLWKPTTAGHWQLYADALYWGSSSLYPVEAYGDLTTAQLANLVSELPPTDSVATAGDNRLWKGLLVFVGALALAGWLTLRLRPRRSPLARSEGAGARRVSPTHHERRTVELLTLHRDGTPSRRL